MILKLILQAIMPVFIPWTNHRGQLCWIVRKENQPLSGQHTGKQERKRVQRAFAARCGGVYSSGGKWFLDRNDGKPDEQIWVTGFPDELFMQCVIDLANEYGENYVISAEDIDEVFTAAAEATSPEGLRRAEEERQRLKKELLEMEAEEEKQRELRIEEKRRREKERYEKRIKDEYASEEAWWLENSSGRMAFLGF
jgi:hypothetical protein